MLLVVLGCGVGQPVVTATQARLEMGSPTAPPPALDRTTTQSVARDPVRPNLHDILCEGRVPCELTAPVGASTIGDEERSVQRIVLRAEPDEDESQGQGCDIEEFWLVARDAQGMVTDYQFVSGGCTEGTVDGAWCGLPPTTRLTLVGERLTVDWWAPMFRCMGAFRSYGSTVLSLRTFLPLATDGSTYHSLSGYSWASSWDYATRSGSSGFDYAPAEREPDDCPDVSNETVLRLPVFTLQPAFEESGWGATPLTPCAATLTPDSLPRAQPGRKGQPSRTEAPLTLEVLPAASGALFIEVRSEKPPGLSATLEVCGGGERYYDADYCHYNPPAMTCTTFDLHGAVRQGKAKVVKAQGLPRYRVTGSGIEGSLFLRYRDPTRGLELRTSRRQPGKPFSDSPLVTAEDISLTCRIVDGSLELLQQRADRRAVQQ